MVTIINYIERQRENGETFFVLEVQGGIEMIKSSQTGSFYATAKKTTIPTTFDEQTCKGLIGTQMEGSIIKEYCDTFEYTVKETGEIIEISHKWVYDTEETEPLESKENVFSQNGILEPAL